MSSKSYDYLTDEEKRDFRLDESQNLARARHKDYDDVTNEYMHTVRTNEKVRDRILHADDPGEELYRRARSANEVSLEDVFKED